MTQYKKYSFILAVALINIGCTTPSSTGQLAQSCQSACARYSGNELSICSLACNMPDNYQTTDCFNPCIDIACYNQGGKNPNGCQTNLLTNTLYCIETCNACTTGCLAVAASQASTAGCSSLTQQQCNAN